MPSEPSSLGEALKALREAKGLGQSEVVDRIPFHYSNDRAYRRIESGERHPSRQSLVDILARGLSETDAGRIDHFLSLGRYQRLTDQEVATLGLTRTEEQPPQHPLVSVDGSPGPTQSAPVPATSPYSRLLLSGITIISVALTAVLADQFSTLQWWFVLATSTLYASLYPVSIVLETVYGAPSDRVLRFAALDFSAMLLASVLALWIDDHYAQAGNPKGFWIALLIFFVSATVQWVLVCKVLPAESSVTTTFQSLTAQSAHFKNTLYFLSCPALFWLPAVHSALSLNNSLDQKRIAEVDRMLHRGSSFAGGIWQPQPTLLWILLVVVIGLTIPMGARLLDNLLPHPKRNSYLNLFYARALLYFTLCVVCLTWYSASLDSFESQFEALK